MSGPTRWKRFDPRLLEFRDTRPDVPRYTCVKPPQPVLRIPEENIVSGVVFRFSLHRFRTVLYCLLHYFGWFSDCSPNVFESVLRIIFRPFFRWAQNLREKNPDIFRRESKVTAKMTNFRKPSDNSATITQSPSKAVRRRTEDNAK